MSTYLSNKYIPCIMHGGSPDTDADHNRVHPQGAVFIIGWPITLKLAWSHQFPVPSADKSQLSS